MNFVARTYPEASFLELGGPLSPEALGSLPTLPKVKAGTGHMLLDSVVTKLNTKLGYRWLESYSHIISALNSKGSTIPLRSCSYSLNEILKIESVLSYIQHFVCYARSCHMASDDFCFLKLLFA